MNEVERDICDAEDTQDRINGLEAHVQRLTQDLQEYVRAERVLVAAGIVTEEKLDQAHEIVRGLRD